VEFKTEAVILIHESNWERGTRGICPPTNRRIQINFEFATWTTYIQEYL